MGFQNMYNMWGKHVTVTNAKSEFDFGQNIDFSKMHILCSKWGSFDSEFYADHEYANILSVLIILSLIKQ